MRAYIDSCHSAGMILRNGWVAGVVCAGLLIGCGDGDRPTGLTNDGSVTLPDAGGGFDIVFVNDGPAPDFGPPPDVQPSDRQPTQSDGAADVTRSDGPEDVSLILDTGPDAGRTLRSFCGFTQREMVQLSVRAATCFHESPQRLLEQMYRPSWWMEGVLARRPCNVLRAALEVTDGCTGFLGRVLKVRVEPTSTGTCAAEVVGCRSGEPGRELAVTCRNGHTISEDCENVTGVSMCLASAGAVGCRSLGPEGAACTESTPARCYNGRVQQCVGGAFVNRFDCDTSLTTCDATANACVGSGAACTGDVDTCNGTSIQQCRGGRLHSNNCSFFVGGSSCRTVGGHSFCGTASECDPVSSPADGTCDGSTLVLCAGGVTERFNCVSAGFVGCGVGGCTQ